MPIRLSLQNIVQMLRGEASIRSICSRWAWACTCLSQLHSVRHMFSRSWCTLKPWTMPIVDILLSDSLNNSCAERSHWNKLGHNKMFGLRWAPSYTLHGPATLQRYLVHLASCGHFHLIPQSVVIWFSRNLPVTDSRFLSMSEGLASHRSHNVPDCPHLFMTSSNCRLMQQGNRTWVTRRTAR